LKEEEYLIPPRKGGRESIGLLSGVSARARGQKNLKSPLSFKEGEKGEES